LTALPVQAEEGFWIDGIKFRYGTLSNTTALRLPWVEENSTIIEVNKDFSHLAETPMFPIAITLPETLMNSWSFRGALFEYQPKTELKDLAPATTGTLRSSRITPSTEQFRQKDELRTSLYNNFFNASDKAFADANSNWALSADVIGSRIFLGYYWGVFLPYRPPFRQAERPHMLRFFKFGMGLGVYYVDLSYKLNLCSQYKVTPKVEDGKAALNGHGGECVGKTEIDSASNKWGGVAFVSHVAIWEGVSKEGILKFFVMDYANDLGSLQTSGALKLKNHSKNLEVGIEINSFEILSYTYRF
jgi:hypothetical protein